MVIVVEAMISFTFYVVTVCVAVHRIKKLNASVTPENMLPMNYAIRKLEAKLISNLQK